MVIMDGFNVSHCVENMEILDKKIVQEFVGEYNPEEYLLDVKNPVTFGPLALQNVYFEFRKDIYDAFDTVQKELEKIYEEYEKISGRKYEVIAEYKTDGAEKVLVIMGSVAGTIKDAIDELEKNGEKTGLLEISMFRPFPYEDVKNTLKEAKEVIVLDRNLAFGTKQVLASEIIHSVGNAHVRSVVYGLGGRDTFKKQIIKLAEGENDSGYLL